MYRPIDLSTYPSFHPSIHLDILRWRANIYMMLAKLCPRPVHRKWTCTISCPASWAVASTRCQPWLGRFLPGAPCHHLSQAMVGHRWIFSDSGLRLQDGRSASMTAPNGPSQQACILQSMREADSGSWVLLPLPLVTVCRAIGRPDGWRLGQTEEREREREEREEREIYIYNDIYIRQIDR